MTDSNCVVCGASISPGKERFANAWEASLGTHPCCSDACAGQFNIDKHWMPHRPPERPSSEEIAARIDHADLSLHNGVAPSTVIRELLVAGVPAEEVRNVIQKVIKDIEEPSVSPEEESSRRLTFWTGLFGVISALVTGWFFIAGTTNGCTRSSIDVDKIVRVTREVDSWEQRFG